MGQPAAKRNDGITGTDTHMVVVPNGPAVPQTQRFSGVLDGSLSSNVNIMGQAAATVGSTASNRVPHLAVSPGTSFVTPPGNRGSVRMGSATVRINGKPAARNGDTALTCNDPADLPVGRVIASGTVNIG